MGVEDDGDLCVVFVDVSMPFQNFVCDDNFDKLKVTKAAPGSSKAGKASPKTAAKTSPKVAAKSSPKQAAKSSPKQAAKASPKSKTAAPAKTETKKPVKKAAEPVAADAAFNKRVA